MGKEKIIQIIHECITSIINFLGFNLFITQDNKNITTYIKLKGADTVKYPETYIIKDNSIIASTEIITHKQVSLYVIENSYITGSESFIFSDINTLIRLDQSQSEHSKHKIRRPIKYLKQSVYGATFPIGGRGTGNRGHFICEHLPRYLLAKEFLGKNYQIKILLTPQHADWQKEYLKYFGVTDDELIIGSKGTTWCEKIIFVPNLSPGVLPKLYRPDIYTKISQNLSADFFDQDTPKWIFISRNDANSRKLQNELELYEYCKSIFPKIQLITLSGKSLKNQISIFKNAEVIIGAHGQSFNLNIVTNNCLIVQLIPGNQLTSNHYYQWAINYACLGSIQKSNCINLFSGNDYLNGDWNFPIGKFKHELEIIINHKFITIQNRPKHI